MAANAPTRHVIDKAIQLLFINNEKLNIDEANFYSTISSLSQVYMCNGISGVTIISTNGLFQGGANTTCLMPVPTGQPNTASQVQSVVTLAYGVGTVTIANGGGSYVTGDLVNIGSDGGIGYVTASAGAVTAVTFTESGTRPGTGYALASAVSTTGGTGTGLTVNITGLCLSAQVAGLGTLAMSTEGSGYGCLFPPSTTQNGGAMITLTDSGGGLAVLLAVLGNTYSALNYLPSEYTSIQAAATDMNSLSNIVPGTAVVLYGGTKTVTSATNAIDMVVTLASVAGLGVGQFVENSGFTPSAFNGGPYMITSITLTSTPAGTIILNNASAPGSSYVSGGLITVLGNMPINGLVGYNSLANLAANSGLVQL